MARPSKPEQGKGVGGVNQAMLQIGRAGFGASVLGVILGLVICVGALRLMRSVVFGVGIYDASTLSAVVATLGVVALDSDDFAGAENCQD